MKKTTKLLNEQKAQALTEYAVLLGTVVIAIVVSLLGFKAVVGTYFNDMTTSIEKEYTERHR